MFSDKDLKQFEKKNIPIETINEQISHFKNGFPFATLVRPATISDGIFAFNDDEVKALISYYETHQKNYDVIKFVPASGAASRMFKNLYAFMTTYTGTPNQIIAYEKQKGNQSVKYFFEHLKKFAFYNSLKKVMAESGYDLEDCLEKKYFKIILEYFLTDKGLNYANRPKALLLFHKYEDACRYAFEEHLVEGANYAQAENGKVKIHFTVSPDHMELFKDTLNQKKVRYESKFMSHFEVTYSVQKPSTDTIAVTPKNEPFRNADGSILFRPGGHGALIENLNELEADIIFIKNIDNVVPDRLKPETYKYKKVLGGYLLQIKDQVDDYLEWLDEGSATPEELMAMKDFAIKKLNIPIDEDTFKTMEPIEQTDYLYTLFNRPIRVAGMVKNEGEPGGGPFWVFANNKESLQIVEKAQIDFENPQQAAMAEKATHFNPVDLVCATRDFKGNLFDLHDFIDPDTGFISDKSKDGRKLKALELPGLWNGAMAEWITIFVEVPIITFNPVKIVNDLLRDNHQ
jgi:hypothetical protein